MADKLLICVTAEQATAGISHNGKLGACESFPNDDRGAESFDRYLKGLRHMPVLVMVDAVEEDYRFELLPHASGRDRADQLSRRLRQLYRNTAFCSYLPQGRDTGKRRDDQYLFFALTNPDVLNGWLGIVRTHELPVAGVYLLPIVAQALAQKLAPAKTNLLLVSRHPSGIRLTFFREGKLRISRLTRMESADPRGLAAYTEEIANTRLYLHALRIMTLDEHMDVLILDHDSDLAGLEQSVTREISNAQATLLDVRDIAKAVGVSDATMRSGPDTLFLHYLGRHPPIGNLAPDSVTERFQIYQLRRALYATAATVTVASIGWGGMNAYQIYDLRAQRDLAARHTLEYQRRYQEVTRKFPAIPTNTDNLVLAVQTAERLKATRRNPEQAMIAISRALEQYPNVWLKGFGWKYATREFDTESNARAGDNTWVATAAAVPGVAQNSRRQSAYIEAEIRPFHGDFRATLDDINGFVEALKKDPRVAEVRVVTLPLNVNPNMALTGSTTDTGARATSAPFRLHLRFRSEP
jgi:hypothetical protein